tara:strand:- start:137 stop:787 length:651 start_codon:yes stop_codon:yes gene_type:complete
MHRKDKAIIFDLDGTLLNSGLTFHKIVNMLKLEVNEEPVDFESVRKFSSRGASLILKNCFQNEDENTLDSLKVRFLNIYEKVLTENLVLYDGVDSMLDLFERNQIAWGIVTNKSWKFTGPIVKKLGWDKRTSAIICPDSLINSKPDPEGLNKAIEMLSANIDDSFYVGDHRRDIETGKNAGVKTIACDWGYWEDDCKTWNADFIASHPKQIIEWTL